MASFKLDLSGITAGALTDLLKNGKISVDGTEKTLADYGATLDGAVLTIPNYGTLTFTNTSTTTGAVLKLSSSAPAATYDITGHSTDVSVTEIDASAMTNAFTLGTLTGSAVTKLTTGAGADTVTTTTTNGATLANITTGAGADTITVADSTTAVNVNAGADDDKVIINAKTADTSKVSLGAGADTLEVTTAGTAATLEVADYSYADGDVIVMDDTAANVGAFILANTGVGSFGTAKTTLAKVNSADNAYKAKVKINGTTQEYWTASGAGAVSFNASGKTTTTNMNASAATTASITLGAGTNDKVTVSSSGTNNVTIAKNNGTATFDSALDSADTLVVTGGSLDALKFEAAKVEYVGTTLDGAAVAEAAKKGQVKVSFDGGTTVKTLAYANATAATLDQATDVSLYKGFSDGDTTLNASTDVNLWDTTTYSAISKVTVGASAKAATIIGNSDAKTTISAAAATKSLNIWGGSTDSDAITLATATTTSDTVWFGTLDGKGVDTVANFDNGFKSTSDVLKLYDTSAVSSVTFATTDTVGKLDISTGKSTIEVAGADTDEIEVMLSDGTVKKVAVDTAIDAAGTTADTINAAGADYVIGTKATAKTNEVSYNGGTDSVTVNLWDTDHFVNVTNINMDNSTGKSNVIVGSKTNASAITVGSGTNVVWAGNTDANTISVASGATDTILYAGATTDATLNDGKDTITGTFTSDDTIMLYDVSSTKEMFNTYEIKASGTNSVISNNTMTDSTMTDSTLTVAYDISDSAKKFKLMDKTGTTVKAEVTGVSADLAFATDVQIYGGGNGAVAADNQVTGTQAVFLDNGGWADAGSYYFAEGINTFNASSSAADWVLIGRAATASTLQGGTSTNVIWGGGVATQTMIGNDAAVDTIMFGTKDGADVAQQLDKGDTIYLYDVTDISNVKMTVDTKTEKIDISNTSSVLSISDTGNKALTGGLTFQLQNGSKYTYNTTSKSFVAK